MGRLRRASEGAVWVGTWGCTREAGQRAAAYGLHTSDILCGAFIARWTGKTDARVAVLIAAVVVATVVAIFIAALVAQGVPPAVATLVARLVTRGPGVLCVAAGKNAAAMLARREVRRRAGRGEQPSRSRSSSQTTPGAAADRVGRRLSTRSARGASRREMGAPSRWRWRALRRRARGWG